MNENDIEIIEYIMQSKISNFIKNNKDMDKRKLAIEIDSMLEEKEKMYNMSKEELEEILRKKK